MELKYDKSQIGKILKETRKSARLKQYEVAAAIGVGNTHMSMVENGRYHLMIPHYVDLVNFYSSLGIITNVEALATGVDRGLRPSSEMVTSVDKDQMIAALLERDELRRQNEEYRKRYGDL